MILPTIPNQTGAAKVPVSGFGGLERRVGAGNGTICDMTNLTGDDAPVLSSRPKRETAYGDMPHTNGITAVGSGLYWVDGRYLRRDGVMYPPRLVAGSTVPRRFAALGKRLVIFPDKIVVDTQAEPETVTAWQTLAASTTRSCKFADGTYAGEPAAGNTIIASAGSFDWGTLFKVGDGVTVSGSSVPGNNKTAVVREIEGNRLRFYENVFTTTADFETGITVARTVPDLDFICVNDNRVWGCKGDTICCCKLGDPANWNVFDGLSTDAWSVDTGTPGDFTGCVSFMGYPVFFKADRIFKVYGNRPGNFEVMSSATLGVLPGAADTMAVAGETLFYLSRAGFVRYNGGYPSAVDAALNAKYTGGAAGSDGRKYYVSAVRDDGAREMLVFDPGTGLWHKEDALTVEGFANVGPTLYAQTAHANVIVAGAAEPDEADFESSVTFADWDMQSFGSKYPVRLWLRLESAGAVTVEISYNGGSFETAATIPAGGKGVSYVPVPIRRCDRFGLRLTTTGAWKLYAMEIETRAERTNRR